LLFQDSILFAEVLDNRILLTTDPTAYCPKTGPTTAGAGDCRVNRLRSGAAIEAKHPAEPLDAIDRPDRGSRTGIALDQAVVVPLMIPLPVIMRGELTSSFAKRPFTEEDHSVEALILD